MTVTTKDIAKICGVSRGTVDRALNGRKGINVNTQEQILKVANELGYKPDLLARSLVKGKTMSIGVVYFDIKNYFFSEMLNSIEKTAKEKGYFVYITLTERDKDMEIELIENLVSRKVDGILILPINFGTKFEETLNRYDLPFVSIGNAISDSFPFVGIDDKSAAKSAIEHMLSLGYEKILYISPPLSFMGITNIYAQKKRYEGVLEALKEYPSVEFELITSKNYLQIIDESLDKCNKKTAAFCSSDIYAIRILRNMRDLGKRVPEDLGVMGFDNIEVLRYITPSLTTVNNPANTIGKTAIDQLIDKINGKQISNRVNIEHQIIKGDTLK